MTDAVDIRNEQIAKRDARIAELEFAIHAFVDEVDEQHRPEWVSAAAKAAGKEPWVCTFCGPADGGWPCAERLSLDDLKAVVGPFVAAATEPQP